MKQSGGGVADRLLYLAMDESFQCVLKHTAFGASLSVPGLRGGGGISKSIMRKLTLLLFIVLSSHFPYFSGKGHWLPHTYYLNTLIHGQKHPLDQERLGAMNIKLHL